MDTLFSNVTVVTMDEELRVLFSAFVGVTDGKISYLSRKAPQEQPKKIINGEGMVLMPGLINCHTHLAMSPLRGYADDVELSTWLNDYIFPREDRLDGRCVKAATLLSLAECLRFGTTSVSDMYYFCDEIAGAVAQSGIKANLSHGTSAFSPEAHFTDTNGYKLIAAFDVAENEVGKEISGIRIRHIDELEAFCEENKPKVAVLCVPRDGAEQVSGRLVDLGIEGFWNFSHYDLSVPYPDVVVENVHLGDSLMSLGYRLRNQE